MGSKPRASRLKPHASFTVRWCERKWFGCANALVRMCERQPETWSADEHETDEGIRLEARGEMNTVTKKNNARTLGLICAVVAALGAAPASAQLTVTPIQENGKLD